MRCYTAGMSNLAATILILASCLYNRMLYMPLLLELMSFVVAAINGQNLDTGMYIHAHKYDGSKHLPAFCDHRVIRMYM